MTVADRELAIDIVLACVLAIQLGLAMPVAGLVLQALARVLGVE